MKDAKGHGSDSRGAAHQEGINQIGGKYTANNDVRDEHRGELYGSITATHNETGRQVGSIDYGAYWNSGHREVGIKMINVDPEHQHQGVATQMMDKLRSEFTEPGHSGPKIKWGGTTAEGEAFKRAYYRGKK